MRLGQTSIIYALSKFVASGIGFCDDLLDANAGEEIYGFYAITLALVSWLGLVKGSDSGTRSSSG